MRWSAASSVSIADLRPKAFNVETSNMVLSNIDALVDGRAPYPSSPG
jgi:hypothetical protein